VRPEYYYLALFLARFFARYLARVIADPSRVSMLEAMRLASCC
jgi:hypothetical protein